jgi:transmembrane sensor
MSDHEQIITLIAKQLQGLATPQETEELQLWLHADAAHQQEYNELALIWQKSGPLLADPQFDANIGWLKLDDKISQSSRKTRIPFDKVVSFRFSVKKVAMAVVLVSAIAFGGYWYSRHAGWQTLTATAQNQSFALPDQSVILLRKGSTLQVPKQFDAKERVVRLTGEAFFNVQHNEQQPFKITTAHSAIKVLGTSFLVNAGENEDEVVVITGKVHVTDKNESENQVTLSPGERAVLLHDHFYQNQVTDSNFIAWKTGSLVFNNASLQKVLQDVTHYYDIPVEMAPGTENPSQPFTVTVQFENQPLEQALEEIKLITGLSMKKAPDKIIFYRK